MPASGPTPGRTPTSVPTRQPMNPYQSTPGVSATENPRARFWSVSPTSDPERPARQRHAQHGVEQVERSQRDAQGHHERQHAVLALEDEEQERHHDGHGDAIAET